MSDYTIEVIGNEPYYIEVSGSTSNTIHNLEVVQTSGTIVEISSDYQNVLLSDLPSGYPISNTSGLLPYTRISGLSSYVYSVTTSLILGIANQAISEIDGGSP